MRPAAAFARALPLICLGVMSSFAANRAALEVGSPADLGKTDLLTGEIHSGSTASAAPFELAQLRIEEPGLTANVQLSSSPVPTR